MALPESPIREALGSSPPGAVLARLFELKPAQFILFPATNTLILLLAELASPLLALGLVAVVLPNLVTDEPGRSRSGLLEGASRRSSHPGGAGGLLSPSRGDNPGSRLGCQGFELHLLVR